MTQPSPDVLCGARLPPRVRDLPKPPEVLFVHGELPRGPSVAIVGTRNPTLDGAAYARHLAGVLARAGVVVVSGGARGIDTAAHEGALDVGGPTVVVAPSGFERPFPEENAALFQRIASEGGAFLSAHAPEVPASQPSFFSRNALLVALAHAVVVAEAPYRSGASNAASQARRLGRPLFVVPHAPWNRRGTLWIAELGRGARLLTDPSDVLRALEDASLPLLPRADAPAPAPAPAPALAREGEPPSRPEPAPPPVPFHPDPEARAVIEAHAAGARHPDEIARRTGLSIPRIQYLLLTLTLQGVLVAAPLNQGARVSKRKH